MDNLKIIFLTLLLTASGIPSGMAGVNGKQDESQKPKSGSQYAKQVLREENMDFFLTDEARRIGDQLLVWQRATGGWPKNIDMVSPMTDAQIKEVMAEKNRRDDSTTDNDATNLQLAYIARLYKATGDAKYLESFRLGVEYLLSGQYENGGWPQFWPEMHEYQPHITYNDDAMVNTMTLLRDIARGASPYDSDICDAAQKSRMQAAFDKGVECILATQIVCDGVPTVWCQQHDHETLLPAPARTYELPSYCSQESAAIVRMLMEIPEPSPKVKTAVHAAMAWFDRNKLTGLSYRRVMTDGKWEAQLIEDPESEMPIWARFYDLEQCRPFVCDRDGIPRRHLDEIGSERRNGYSWYNSRPADLYSIYDSWADKYDPDAKLNISLR